MKKTNFLNEYKDLCIKYNMIIESCGCCDSPWIIDVDSDDIERHLKHLKETEWPRF